MKRLPLYDPDAEIACTIEGAEVPGRVAQVERIRQAMTRLERTEHGMLLHFEPDPATEADLRAFAVDEKRCCAFWGFDLDINDEALTFTWDAPPSASALVDRLVVVLSGDEPITALSGVL